MSQSPETSTKLNENNDMEFDWENRTWDVIDTFFKQENILIDHHLNSFNYFMSNELQSIIREKEYIIKVFNKDTWNEDLQLYTETYQIEFGKIYISNQFCMTIQTSLCIHTKLV
jgi:DNA-directed RNA polymerase beta subunit